MEDLEYNQLKATELTLGLPGAGAADAPKGTKRMISEVDNECQAKAASSEGSVYGGAPAAKTQVVGWPPVRSCRMNSFRARKAEDEDRSGIYVKVSMDGAPYLRKVDLKVHKGYKDLRVALENMFQCFSIGAGEGNDHGSAYAVTYEDKDGDWMLVGDVPFEMFMSSCKRMRIMKGSEAKGLNSSPS